MPPLNAGEECGFTIEHLLSIPDDSYERVETAKEKAKRINAEKAAAKKAEEARLAAEEKANKENGGDE